MDPNKLQQMIMDVCNSYLLSKDGTPENYTKCHQILEQFQPIPQKLPPEVYKAIWGIIQKSDFVVLVGGIEKELVNSVGMKDCEMSSLIIGRGEMYNFGNAIAYLCMQGAQQGLADSAVAFLQKANQMAVGQSGQLPIPKPKIEIVS